MKKLLSYILITLFSFFLVACNNVSPEYVKVESIMLNVSQVQVQISNTYQLQATINPSNATNKDLKWSSSNERVARVANGKIIAIERGNAVIKVSSADGNCFAECVVIVTPYDPNSTPTLKYKLNKDGKSYSIIDVWSWIDAELVVPSTYKDLPVTSIAAYAFIDNITLKKIIISDSVTSIGDGAFFDCTNLTSIEISNSVTSIGEDAFYNCTSLTSITIPDSVTSIGSSAFRDCSSLTSIVFEDTSTWYRLYYNRLYDNNAYENWLNKTGGTETSVINASTNATYFKSTYDNYFWYKL